VTAKAWRRRGDDDVKVAAAVTASETLAKRAIKAVSLKCVGKRQAAWRRQRLKNAALVTTAYEASGYA